ncbi:hypothetical protein [Symbiopectobacterium purcellii]|uniref:hypothetical protein n=1 Tax=Symbiopectobacterium purcellii TaxID=2871826 RepID=UPI003F825FC7
MQGSGAEYQKMGAYVLLCLVNRDPNAGKPEHSVSLKAGVIDTGLRVVNTA